MGPLRSAIRNNMAMDTTQKIKNGSLLALAIVSLVLFGLWLTDVIGLGLVAILVIVMTTISIGIRVWAENAQRQAK
jgi:undecaprenyl pyrophosphate phosphatase UppP